jgi:SHS family lactate transporter-like MFS transporter
LEHTDSVNEQSPMWTTIFGGAFALFFDGFDFSLMAYALTDVESTYNVSLTLATYTMLFALLTRWIGALAIGAYANRFGRKRMLAFSVLFLSITVVLTGLSPTLFILLVVRALFGMAIGGVYATGGAIVVEAAGKRRGFASGIFVVGWFGGATLGPLFYLALFHIVGWEGVFIYGGILSLFLVLYIVLYVKESPIWSKEHAENATAATPHKMGTTDLFRSKYLGITVVLLMIEVGNFFGYSSAGSMFPTFLKVVRHMPLTGVTTIGSLSSFLAMFGAILGGIFSDKVGHRSFVIATFLMCPITIALQFLTDSYVIIVTGAVLWGLFYGALGGVLPALETEQYPTQIRSAGYGFAHNFGALTSSVGPTGVAIILEYVGFSWGVMCVSAFGVLLGLAGTFFLKEHSTLELT